MEVIIPILAATGLIYASSDKKDNNSNKKMQEQQQPEDIDQEMQEQPQQSEVSNSEENSDYIVQKIRPKSAYIIFFQQMNQILAIKSKKYPIISIFIKYLMIMIFYNLAN